MAKRVFFVSGGKGGVGKSTISKTMLDLLKESNPHLVETDGGNPDVFKAYSKTVHSVEIDLRQEDGWIEFLNHIDSLPDNSTIIVNTAARAHESLEKHVSLLKVAINEGISIEWLFVLGTQRESLEILHEHLKHAIGQTHVILNGFFGERKDFTGWEKSQSKKLIEEKQGLCIYIPEFSRKIMTEMDFNRQTFDEAYKNGKLGDKAAIAIYREKAGEAFSALNITN
jgi:response regulator RpfG family c-di-GMP phosphodiesterase